ncbi:MAG: 4-hydroxy-tetrahydrodipicolinate synthase [Christensenellaceae bacterium]|nr:4-hydroxy-tetrahydrodipicolinate synthase [Christensenellaceae bacterium]
MNKVFEGSAVALVTPFTEDGINVPALKKLIDYQIEGGTDAIVLCGTTGEPATMTEEERDLVITEGIKHIAKRVPVIVGTGSNNTAHAIELSKKAEAMGADALLVVTPYYNKCSQEGLKRHFLAIADSVNIPIILYNVPSRTGVNVQAATLREVAKHKNIVGMKEASGDISLVAEMSRLAGDEITLYSGNDDQIIPLMSLGGKGVISVLANIAPKAAHDITHAYLDGDVKRASELQLYYSPLISAMFYEVNPIPVKTALNMMGFEAGPLRLPLCEPSAANTEKLRSVLKEYNLI